MMIAPCAFIKEYENYKYADLIPVRDKLLDKILRFEAAEKSGFRDEKEWDINPSPDVCYQMNLEYLQELLELMLDKYREENVCQWGRF